MTARGKQFAREVSIALVASGIFAAAGVLLTLWVTPQLLAKDIAAAAKTNDAQDDRLTSVEHEQSQIKSDIASIKSNVDLLVDIAKSKWSHP